MRRPDPTARRVLDAYAEAGPVARVHSVGRWWSCPFDLVEAVLPRSGRVLDFGCGHGHFSMYLAMMSPDRDVFGIDIDDAKIEIGRSVVSRAGFGGRVELQAVESGWRPGAEEFDVVVANDVLYLMGVESATSLLDSIAVALRPGGRAVIKEMGDSPRWKHRLNVVQEHLSTRVLRITEGTTVEVLTAGQIESPLRGQGLRVEARRMDRGYPHAHLAFIADR